MCLTISWHCENKIYKLHDAIYVSHQQKLKLYMALLLYTKYRMRQATKALFNVVLETLLILPLYKCWRNDIIQRGHARLYMLIFVAKYTTL